MSGKPKKKSSLWFEKLFGSQIDPSDVRDVLDLDIRSNVEDVRNSQRMSQPELSPSDSKQSPSIDRKSKNLEDSDESYVKYVETHRQLHAGLHEKLKRDNSFTTRVKTLTSMSSENDDDGENMRILLVRHAESEGNLDKSVWTTTPDYNIPLSENGIKQAQEAGQVIKAYYERLYVQMLKDWEIAQEKEPDIQIIKPCKPRVVLWTSPYKRTRQTTVEIIKIAGEWVEEVREHIVLGEQQFGLFEGFDIKELEKFFPTEFVHFTKCVEFGGRFWARPPLGESRFDVATRISAIFPKLIRDAEKHDIRNVIIVSHGVTIRAFCMQWLNRTPEFFEQDQNPDNVGIRLIDKCQDKGYIFKGFKPSKRE